MKKLLKKFTYQDVAYQYVGCDYSFHHGYDTDLHLVIIWSNARAKESQIIDDLHSDFDVLECVEVEWSQRYTDDNFHRLYKVTPSGRPSLKRKEVGGDPFVVAVIRDRKPKYLYRFDASGRLKLVNVNVVDKKNLYRDWVGGNYLVHSTDNLKEFFNNGILLFGPNKLLAFLEKDNVNREKKSEMKSDLLGSHGWCSFEDLFGALNLAADYVVLRGAKYIQNTKKILAEDIDILCADVAEFTSVANAVKFRNSNHLFIVNVCGSDVLFDVRHVGDEYYDKRWQKNILQNKILNDIGVNVPRYDDQFFSLLYHAYIQKPIFHEKYIDELLSLSEKIGLGNVTEDYFMNENNVLKVLKGYLIANEYSVSIPKDKKVFINVRFVSRLNDTNAVKLHLRVFLFKVKVLPSQFFDAIKRLIKQNRILFDLMYKLREEYRSIIGRIRS